MLGPEPKIARSRADRQTQPIGHVQVSTPSASYHVHTRLPWDAFCSGDTQSGLVAQAELIKTMRRHSSRRMPNGERVLRRVQLSGARRSSSQGRVNYDLNLDTGPEDFRPMPSITARVVTINARIRILIVGITLWRRWCQAKR